MNSSRPCVSNKKKYATLALAEDALIEARTKFNFPAATGPVAVYLCEDCGHFHLTSQGKMNDRLAKQIAEGKIDLNKEANHWINKLKKR